MNITKETENKLLKRRELEAFLESYSNPGIEAVTKQIAQKFKTDDNLVVVKKLESLFGARKFIVEAYVYNSEADKTKIEPKKKEKKK